MSSVLLRLTGLRSGKNCRPGTFGIAKYRPGFRGADEKPHWNSIGRGLLLNCMALVAWGYLKGQYYILYIYLLTESEVFTVKY